MSLLSIDQQKCTRCNACADSCPLSLFTAGNGLVPEVSAKNEERCIYCGHCEAVCPSGALTHALSEQAAASAYDQIRKLSPEEVGAYFSSRRSIRQFKSQTVDRKTFERMLEIVRYSPTGTNRQFNHWVIISDPALIQKLAASTIDWMRGVMHANPEMADRLGMRMLIAAFDRGHDRICRKAPHLAICYTPSAYTIGAKDAVIAASHLELLLPSFGLGGCWAGYLMTALTYSPETKKLIGLDDTYSVHAALMLGYPKYKYHKVPARNAARVSWM